ncbi:DUF1007 family protein [Pokkaliibacter sp. CJK22405]|uniref:DUF1007 family protein n=1 Tax=Pokkaliibacter sp. CJK22405 TaxID=3384615 RepID=UPI0039851051
MFSRPRSKLSATKAIHYWLKLSLLAAVSVFSSQVLAHPHGWVDMTVTGIFDQDGKLSALKERWRMDPMFSQVMLEGIPAGNKDEPIEQKLDVLGSKIRDNLASKNNLTHVLLSDTDNSSQTPASLALDDVQDYDTEYRQERLIFSFIVPLKTPVSLAGKTLRYHIYDSTYYIEMLHEADATGDNPLPGALTLQHAPTGCTTSINKAHPDPAKITEAAMLDITQQGEPDLGRFFTETGVITCPN